MGPKKVASHKGNPLENLDQGKHFIVAAKLEALRRMNVPGVKVDRIRYLAGTARIKSRKSYKDCARRMFRKMGGFGYLHMVSYFCIRSRSFVNVKGQLVRRLKASSMRQIKSKLKAVLAELVLPLTVDENAHLNQMIIGIEEEQAELILLGLEPPPQIRGTLTDEMHTQLITAARAQSEKLADAFILQDSLAGRQQDIAEACLSRLDLDRCFMRCRAKTNRRQQVKDGLNCIPFSTLEGYQVAMKYAKQYKNLPHTLWFSDVWNTDNRRKAFDMAKKTYHWDSNLQYVTHCYRHRGARRAYTKLVGREVKLMEVSEKELIAKLRELNPTREAGETEDGSSTSASDDDSDADEDSDEDDVDFDAFVEDLRETDSRKGEARFRLIEALRLQRQEGSGDGRKLAEVQGSWKPGSQSVDLYAESFESRQDRDRELKDEIARNKSQNVQQQSDVPMMAPRATAAAAVPFKFGHPPSSGTTDHPVANAVCVGDDMTIDPRASQRKRKRDLAAHPPAPAPAKSVSSKEKGGKKKTTQKR